MQASGDQQVQQVHYIPQGLQGQTGAGELNSSPTGETFPAPTYISPLPTRAPMGFLPDPRYTIDHAGQAQYFGPDLQQWQAQAQVQLQQGQVQHLQWINNPQAPQ